MERIDRSTRTAEALATARNYKHDDEGENWIETRRNELGSDADRIIPVCERVLAAAGHSKFRCFDVIEGEHGLSCWIDERMHEYSRRWGTVIDSPRAKDEWFPTALVDIDTERLIPGYIVLQHLQAQLCEWEEQEQEQLIYEQWKQLHDDADAAKLEAYDRLVKDLDNKQAEVMRLQSRLAEKTTELIEARGKIKELEAEVETLEEFAHQDEMNQLLEEAYGIGCADCNGPITGRELDYSICHDCRETTATPA